MSKYWTRSILGLLICGASVVALDNGLYHLVRTGSCGSSGTYISARPCPPGTGLHILSLMGGVFGGLIGMAVWATRDAEQHNARPSRVPLGLMLWMLLFVTIAGSVAVAAFGPANNDSGGARLTAAILGVIFIPMGLAPLALAFAGPKRKKLVHLAKHGKRCTGVVLHVEDTGMTINDNPHVKITVRAEPPGEAPFTVEKKTTVSRVKIPRAGDRCVVFYDPSDRTKLNGLTFDPVPGFVHPGTSGPPASPKPSVSGGAPFVWKPPAAAAAKAKPDEDEDPLEKIEKLGDLRDRGLISNEEFEAKKKELLSEL